MENENSIEVETEHQRWRHGAIVWVPTPHLRWRNGVLEQKVYAEQTGYIEWRAIPTVQP